MPGRRKRKKPLDNARTLQNYADRMNRTADADPEFLTGLSGKFLATYDVYGTTRADDARPSTDETRCGALVLMDIARERGIDVRGVTSERKRKGVYLCDARRSEPCVYCGKYSYWGTRETSKYAVRSCDYVYASVEPLEPLEPLES